MVYSSSAHISYADLIVTPYVSRDGYKWRYSPRDRRCAGRLGKSRDFPHTPVYKLQLRVLLQVNSFPLSDRIQSLGETNDGQAFWEMLCMYNRLQATEMQTDRK